jgi:hypothetical protein
MREGMSSKLSQRNYMSDGNLKTLSSWIPLPVLMMLLVTLPASAQSTVSPIDRAQALDLFEQAAKICARDDGKLWGRPLCGPMLLVDPGTRSVVANQEDANGQLKKTGDVFVGTLSQSQPVSDTTINWLGTRWCELIWPWPMTVDADMRHVMLAHELFHRIQLDDLHINKSDGDNPQLDTLEGRYLIELEWLALSAALRATTSTELKRASTDAILFRRERYRLFPAAAQNELALESNEGIAEYTGVRLGLPTPEARALYAVRDLSMEAQASSFVRSFAYATGPAYGVLLDRVDPGWQNLFIATQTTESFDQRLQKALHLLPPDHANVLETARTYDIGGELRRKETLREEQKQIQLTAYKKLLVDEPILSLPLTKPSYEFKPQTLVPFLDIGTVYPTLTLRDIWGELVVQNGGALVRKDLSEVLVSAGGFDPASLSGKGFSLTLKPGWAIQPGVRSGDLLVIQLKATDLNPRK